MLKDKVIIKNQRDHAQLLDKMEENKVKVEYNIKQEMEVKNSLHKK